MDQTLENVYAGVYRAHPRGFGFVTIEGEEEDIYIAGEDRQGVLHGDTVECKILPSREGKRREGKIIRILSRGTTHIVGCFEKNKKYGFVRPDDMRFTKDIFIPIKQSMKAVTGHKVVVELTSYGDRRNKPEGKVVEIIGHASDPGTDILSIVKSYDLPTDFSEKVRNQAERVAKDVSEADCQGRLDLRDTQMVTIDGEDAKDLDDAVSLEKDGEDYILGVHIADVANYVQARSALDREAYRRGTSVYLADRVIPMLPRTLSNGICSLNMGEDRLALSCIMRVNKQGSVVDHQIAETVIRVDERMSYTDVRALLEDDPDAKTERYKDVLLMLQEMGKLAAILRRQRHKRGSIDFDFPETKMILDADGHPLEVRPYERNVATQLIEEFMLLANETVAQEYFWREIPFLYRTHAAPDEDKMKNLTMFVKNLGLHIHMSSQQIHPKDVQKLLERMEDTVWEPMVCRLALRSMKQAGYTPENTGHFGLASSAYCHFTSPIRRYPDLQIHRIIKDDLRGRLTEEKREHYARLLSGVAQNCSERERLAEEAEHETVRMKKAEYMADHLGEVFEGVISGITKWGIYVELYNCIEGMIHVVNMRDDHYVYLEDTYEMVGQHTGKSYRLGEKLLVRVVGADKLQKTIDFKIAGRKRQDVKGTDQTDSEQ